MRLSYALRVTLAMVCSVRRGHFTAGEALDVLAALNPAALKNPLQCLKQGGSSLSMKTACSLKIGKRLGALLIYLQMLRKIINRCCCRLLF